MNESDPRSNVHYLGSSENIMPSCFLLDDGASSIAALVRLEQALSDEAASTSVPLSVPAVLALQAKLWLAIGRSYLCVESSKTSTIPDQLRKLHHQLF